MSKIIDSLVQASLDSKDYAGVVLAKFHFDPIIRFTNAYQNIYWDESGGGEVEYTGAGNLASMSVLTETNELAAQTVQFSLSGIPSSIITDVFSDEYIGKPVYVWYGTLDKTTYAVEGGQNGPVLIFAGLMDFSNIEFGQTSTIIVNATSRLADWERPRGGRFNQAYQQRHVDPTDAGFKFVKALQDKPISWGAYTLTDPPGTGGMSKCFAPGSMFRMADGSLKAIEDIDIHDEMLMGGKVEMVMRGNGIDQEWFNYKGTHLSGTHKVFEEGEWKRVDESKYAISIPAVPVLYTLDNTNHLMIDEHNNAFSDYQEMNMDDVEIDISTEYLNTRTWLNKELLELIT